MILKKLRSTQIGAKTYDCYFEEVEGKDGQKKLTLIMRDENNKELERQELNSDLMTDEYESYILNQVD